MSLLKGSAIFDVTYWVLKDWGPPSKIMCNECFTTYIKYFPRHILDILFILTVCNVCSTLYDTKKSTVIKG